MTPPRGAAAIYEVVNSDERRHWVLLGSDAYRLSARSSTGSAVKSRRVKEITFGTDFPNATAPAVL